jgi:hypothetical protein
MTKLASNKLVILSTFRCLGYVIVSTADRHDPSFPCKNFATTLSGNPRKYPKSKKLQRAHAYTEKKCRCILVQRDVKEN